MRATFGRAVGANKLARASNFVSSCEADTVHSRFVDLV